MLMPASKLQSQFIVRNEYVFEKIIIKFSSEWFRSIFICTQNAPLCIQQTEIPRLPHTLISLKLRVYHNKALIWSYVRNVRTNYGQTVRKTYANECFMSKVFFEEQSVLCGIPKLRQAHMCFTVD